MHASLNAIRWAMPRLALVIGALVLIPLFAYSALIAAIVIRQALAGQ